ncbi:MAG: hypothetical protein JSR17_00315 [Proteobacteria bacterium]|nr:hypothetical protein [Pseudomonadota bacterium]
MINAEKRLCRLTPFLTVRDIDKAIRFYESALGFRQAHPPLLDDAGQVLQVVMSYADADIWLRPESVGTNSKAPITMGAESPVWICMTCASDLDVLYKQVLDAGAKVILEPHERYGLRWFKVQDPDGHSWSFHQPLLESVDII